MIHADTQYATTSMPFQAPCQGGTPWYALHVRHNFEFKVFDRLAAFDIEAFLPSYPSIRKWNDRTVQLERPLFPGYLFVRNEWSQKLRVISHTGVISIVGGQDSSIEDDTIARLKLAVAMKSASPVDLPTIQPGDRIRVIAGPFVGMEGTLERRKANCCVIVTIESLARSFALEVSREDIQIIET